MLKYAICTAATTTHPLDHSPAAFKSAHANDVLNLCRLASNACTARGTALARHFPRQANLRPPEPNALRVECMHVAELLLELSGQTAAADCVRFASGDGDYLWLHAGVQTFQVTDK